MICLLWLSVLILSSSAKESLFDDDIDRFDPEDVPNVGSLFTHVFADSSQQLILDLDLFHAFMDYQEEYRKNIREGNVEMVKFAMQIINKLKELDVSPGCISDVFHFAWTAVEYATFVDEARNCSQCQCAPYIYQKRNERQWIFNVLDAVGKVPAGISSGNNLWVGSWTTCRKISVAKNRQGQHWKGQYCLTHLNSYYRDNPLKALAADSTPEQTCLAPTNATQVEEDDGRCFDMLSLVNFGLCVPNTCTDYDVRKMVGFVIKAAETMVGRDVVCNVTVECRPETTPSITDNRLAVFALVLMIFVSVMVLFGSLYDYSVSGEERRESPFFIRFIKAFSVYSNGRKILSTDGGSEQIACLYGMRFLSMAWIILGHTYYYLATSLTTDNLLPTLINFPKMLYTQIIVQAPLAVDSFFYLSGMLASYLTFKKLMKDKMKFSVESPMFWLMMIVRRYLRLTALYSVIMLLDVTLFTYVSDGPFWRPIESGGCRKTWWVNLLYLNNFLLQDEECCMGWTWYLANDFQFHLVITPILVIAYRRNIKLGAVIAFVGIVISAVIKLIIMEIRGYPPAPLLTSKLQIVEILNAYWTDLYVKPYVRAAPFICGVSIGFLIVHLSKDRRDTVYILPKKYVVIGWTLSTIMGLYSVFGLYGFARTGDISDWWRILYVLLGRNSFAFAISWVTFACATGNGGIVNDFLSWKFFTPLGKITYGAYLIHPVLLQIYNLSRPHSFHFTTFAQMLRLTIEGLFVSYVAAFVLSMLIETPANVLEGMLFERRQDKKPRQLVREDAPEERKNGKNGVESIELLPSK